MFTDYLHLGLRRNPLLTALMVMAIGFGVASSTAHREAFRFRGVGNARATFSTELG